MGGGPVGRWRTLKGEEATEPPKEVRDGATLVRRQSQVAGAHDAATQGCVHGADKEHKGVRPHGRPASTLAKGAARAPVGPGSVADHRPGDEPDVHLVVAQPPERAQQRDQQQTLVPIAHALLCVIEQEHDDR